METARPQKVNKLGNQVGHLPQSLYYRGSGKQINSTGEKILPGVPVTKLLAKPRALFKTATLIRQNELLVLSEEVINI